MKILLGHFIIIKWTKITSSTSPYQTEILSPEQSAKIHAAYLLVERLFKEVHKANSLVQQEDGSYVIDQVGMHVRALLICLTCLGAVTGLLIYSTTQASPSPIKTITGTAAASPLFQSAGGFPKPQAASSTIQCGG